MIREATVDDIPRLMELGLEMFHESRYGELYSFDTTAVRAVFLHYITDKDCLALISDNGLVLAQMQKQWFCKGLMTEDRLIYVSKNHRKGLEGVRLIKAYMKWAKSLGVHEIFIGNATGINFERVGKLYEKLGFEQIGGYYVMENDIWDA